MKGKVCIYLLIVMMIMGVAGDITPAYAHGANIEYESNMTYKIEATFEDGSPMDNAQVIVYAPENPEEPWEQGSTDKAGVFYLTPDLSQSGQWLVQVRKGGHGSSVNIEIAEGQFVSGDTGFNTGQIILMAACVIWGLVGTALYFQRKKE